MEGRSPTFRAPSTTDSNYDEKMDSSTTDVERNPAHLLSIKNRQDSSSRFTARRGTSSRVVSEPLSFSNCQTSTPPAARTGARCTGDGTQEALFDGLPSLTELMKKQPLKEVAHSEPDGRLNRERVSLKHRLIKGYEDKLDTVKSKITSAKSKGHRIEQPKKKLGLARLLNRLSIKSPTKAAVVYSPSNPIRTRTVFPPFKLTSPDSVEHHAQFPLLDASVAGLAAPLRLEDTSRFSLSAFGHIDGLTNPSGVRPPHPGPKQSSEEAIAGSSRTSGSSGDVVPQRKNKGKTPLYRLKGNNDYDRSDLSIERFRNIGQALNDFDERSTISLSSVAKERLSSLDSLRKQSANVTPEKDTVINHQISSSPLFEFEPMNYEIADSHDVFANADTSERSPNISLENPLTTYRESLPQGDGCSHCEHCRAAKRASLVKPAPVVPVVADAQPKTGLLERIRQLGKRAHSTTGAPGISSAGQRLLASAANSASGIRASSPDGSTIIALAAGGQLRYAESVRRASTERPLSSATAPVSGSLGLWEPFTSQGPHQSVRRVDILRNRYSGELGSRSLLRRVGSMHSQSGSLAESPLASPSLDPIRRTSLPAIHPAFLSEMLSAGEGSSSPRSQGKSLSSNPLSLRRVAGRSSSSLLPMAISEEADNKEVDTSSVYEDEESVTHTPPVLYQHENGHIDLLAEIYDESGFLVDSEGEGDRTGYDTANIQGRSASRSAADTDANANARATLDYMRWAEPLSTVFENSESFEADNL